MSQEATRDATVTVYTAGPACVQCRATERDLNKRGILFNLVHVDDAPDVIAAAKARKKPITQAPLVIDHETGDMWGGYNPGKIEKLASNWPNEEEAA